VTVGTGHLPAEAQRWLIDASQSGRPGSARRAAAINAAYRRIEEQYPEYLKQKDEDYG
jgi:hypothetical protein